MTKDDKEFFDKAMIAAIAGLSSFNASDCTNSDIASVGEAAKLVADHALLVRNQYLADRSYQEPQKAEIVPDFFGNLSNQIQSGDSTLPEDIRQKLRTSTGILVRDILEVVEANKGKKMMVSEIYMLLPRPFESDEQPTMNQLRDIGFVLRERGYRTKRIGGKDLYVL